MSLKSILRRFAVISLAAAAWTLSVIPVANAITVDIYSGFEMNGGGTPFTGFVGSFQSPNVRFASNTGYDWHPFGLSEFGARIYGALDVETDGAYSFFLNSSDGSLLFIDGGLLIDNGGQHSPQTLSDSTFLTAGLHSFEIQFFKCCGGESGVDLRVSEGVTFAVPAPGALALLGVGLIGFPLLGRRSNKARR